MSQNNSYRIKDILSSERPRERLAREGAGVLSDAELLAILLRVGIEGENAVQLGNRLLTTFGSLRGLHQASVDEIAGIKGFGLAKAVQIKAAIELGQRMHTEETRSRPFIGEPRMIYDLVHIEMSAFNQENLWVIVLDTRNYVLDIVRLYQGTLNASTVRVGEIFEAAIRMHAASIILVHNHPSGDPSPSPEDINLTRQAAAAGKLMDIEVLDHVIIGTGKFASLKERGLGL